MYQEVFKFISYKLNSEYYFFFKLNFLSLTVLNNVRIHIGSNPVLVLLVAHTYTNFSIHRQLFTDPCANRFHTHVLQNIVRNTNLGNFLKKYKIITPNVWLFSSVFPYPQSILLPFASQGEHSLNLSQLKNIHTAQGMLSLLQLVSLIFFLFSLSFLLLFCFISITFQTYGPIKKFE